MGSSHPTAPKRHLLTVLLEDYFHAGAFDSTIHHEQWYRFESRFEQNTLRALDLLDRFHIKATFFVLGWIADRQPEIIKEVQRRGHEIASRGYHHRSIFRMTQAEFRDDLARSRDTIERVSGTRVLGYRSVNRWFAPSDLWALDFVAEAGYAYDSSVIPSSRACHEEPWRRFAHQLKFEEKELWEFPLPTYRIGKWLVPIAGGNYFRQLPHSLVKRAVDHWHRTYDAPFVMYFHVWELDPEQPRINAASPLHKVRQYRNLDKMSWVLEDYFKAYRFTGVAEYLELSAALEDVKPCSVERAPEIKSRIESTVAPDQTLESVRQTFVNDDASIYKRPVSIVVPCFNEELALPYLANTLKSVESELEKEYKLHFIFVDDGSSDGTWSSLQKIFRAKSNCTFVRHMLNLGVSAAILTGIHHANTEIVCSIDCDCTYDPHELKNMIPCLTEGIDLVTASPYHPEGKVENVPTWRLALSRVASSLYRHVLRQNLYTYTSCFRVYRRRAVVHLQLRESGFLGVAEMLGRLDLRGSKVVEYPATLQVRLFGQSKMKVVRTIAGHLRLLVRLLAIRIDQKGDLSRTTLEGSLLSNNSIRSTRQTSPSGVQKSE